MGLTQTSGLRKCELIKSCYFKQQKFVVISYAEKKNPKQKKSEIQLVIWLVLKSYLLKGLRK